MSRFISIVFEWQKQWQLQRLELLNQLCFWLWESFPEPSAHSKLNIWQNMPLIDTTQSNLSKALQDPRCRQIKQNLLLGSPLEHLHRLAEICERSAMNLERRSQGIYYTPQNVVTFMVEESFELMGSAQPDHIQGRSLLDPACGAGRLLWQILWYRQQHHPDSPLSPWVQALVGVDLDEVALAIAAFGIHYLWQHFAVHEGPCPPLRLFAQDALACEGETLFLAKELQNTPLLLFLSNPPYVGEKNNQGLFKKLKQGYWQQHYRGRGDLYYFFFHLALDLAQDDSLACLLTPAYFTQATAADYLRQRLKTESHLRQCVDFGTWRIFQQAQGLQSFLCFFQKENKTKSKAQRKTRIYTPEHSHFQLDIPLKRQLSKPGKLKTAELFQAHHHRIHVGSGHRQFQVYFQTHRLLCDLFVVKQGLVTGADKVSQRHLNRLHKEGEFKPGIRLNQGIFVLDEAEALNFASESDTPLVPWFKNSDIQHFYCAPGLQKLIYAGRQVTLPSRFITHLTAFKPILSWRREVQNHRIPWWQLQWPRTAELFSQPAVVLPQRAKRLRAALSRGGNYASADVYFIQPTSENIQDLQELCLLLNAPVMSFWFYHWGKRKGSMLEIYQEPLCSVPLPQHFGHSDCSALWKQMQHQVTSADLRDLHDWTCKLFLLPEDLAEQIWQWYQTNK